MLNHLFAGRPCWGWRGRPGRRSPGTTTPRTSLETRRSMETCSKSTQSLANIRLPTFFLSPLSQIFWHIYYLLKQTQIYFLNSLIPGEPGIAGGTKGRYIRSQPQPSHVEGPSRGQAVPIPPSGQGFLLCWYTSPSSEQGSLHWWSCWGL